MTKASIVTACIFSMVLAGCEDSRISKAETAVANQLIDPESAQFKDVEVARIGSYICGQVNAKNRMGGYVGFTQFSYGPLGGNELVEMGSKDVSDRCSAYPPYDASSE